MFAWLWRRTKKYELGELAIARISDHLAALPFEVTRRMVEPAQAMGQGQLSELQRLCLLAELRLWALISGFHGLQESELGLAPPVVAQLIQQTVTSFCDRPMFLPDELVRLRAELIPPPLKLYDMPSARVQLVQSRYDLYSDLVERLSRDTGRVIAAVTLQVFKWAVIPEEQASAADLIGISTAALAIRRHSSERAAAMLR